MSLPINSDVTKQEHSRDELRVKQFRHHSTLIMPKTLSLSFFSHFCRSDDHLESHFMRNKLLHVLCVYCIFIFYHFLTQLIGNNGSERRLRCMECECTESECSAWVVLHHIIISSYQHLSLSLLAGDLIMEETDKKVKPSDDYSRQAGKA